MLIKTPEEIEAIRQGGKILAEILHKVIQEVKPGVETGYLEEIAVEEAKKAGGRPSFKNYPITESQNFPSMLCTSINEEIVHGPALPSRKLNSGDIIDIDLGLEWPAPNRGERFPINKYSKLGGFYTDMSKTVAVGKISKELKNLIKATQESLNQAIQQVKPGNTLNDIGKAVETYINQFGYSIVREMVGHGVGHEVHEDPNVFNYEIGDNSELNLVLKEGMVLAIEPMVNLGHWKVKTLSNGFTTATKDNSLSAHFEHTVAVTKNGCEILTLR